MNTTRRHLIALAATTLLAAPVLAQDKVTRIVVPFAAGGPIDVTARVLAEAVKGSLGTVIVENRPGAGGNIGMGAVAKYGGVPPYKETLEYVQKVEALHILYRKALKLPPLNPPLRAAQ